MLPGTARTMRRMEKATGRSDDMMILRGVNVFPTQIEELILRLPELAPHYQCVLIRPNRMDELTVRVEARNRTASVEDRARTARQLGQLIKETVGVTVHVDVVEPEALERSVGKAKRVIDLRSKT